MSLKKNKVALIGCGKLGINIAYQLINSKVVKACDLCICEADSVKRKALRQKFTGSQLSDNVLEAVKNAEIIILAVRPQDVDSVGEELRGNLSNQTVLSVVTAKTVGQLSTLLGTKRIVRCSTNILLETSEAFSFWFAGKQVSKDHLQACKNIISSWGRAKRESSEKKLKQAVVDSGSYVGLINIIFQAFINSQIKRGRSKKEAIELVLSQTAAIARRGLEKGIAPSKIAGQVTTPGGITVEACDIYDKNQLALIIHLGNLAADKKVDELS